MSGIIFLVITAIVALAWLFGAISGWAAIGIILFVVYIIGSVINGNNSGNGGPPGGGGGGGKKLPLPVKMAGAGIAGYAIGKKLAKL